MRNAPHPIITIVLLPVFAISTGLATIRIFSLPQTPAVLVLLFTIILSAWRGGFTAGLSALALGVITGSLFIREPQNTFTLSLEYVQVSSIFIVVASSVMYLLHRLKVTNDGLRHQASHDPLTNLANRRFFYERLDNVLKTSQRHETSFAVLYADLDGFGSFNNDFGHDVGDALLKESALRLTRAVRSEDTVSRFGGDEFVILLPDVTKGSDFATVASKVLRLFGQPMIIGNHRLEVSISIGVAHFPADGSTADDLIKHANIALQEAKRTGKNRYTLYRSTDAL